MPVLIGYGEIEVRLASRIRLPRLISLFHFFFYLSWEYLNESLPSFSRRKHLIPLFRLPLFGRFGFFLAMRGWVTPLVFRGAASTLLSYYSFSNASSQVADVANKAFSEKEHSFFFVALSPPPEFALVGSVLAPT